MQHRIAAAAGFSRELGQIGFGFNGRNLFRYGRENGTSLIRSETYSNPVTPGGCVWVFRSPAVTENHSAQPTINFAAG
jgi:hypothetical protein